MSITVEVDICNSALVKLGALPVNDLNDDTKEARLCRFQYPKIRDSVLRSAPWSFALKRKALAITPSYPQEFGVSDMSAFVLPEDCVRVWKLYDRNTKYMIQGRLLLADSDEAQIFYVSNNIPVSQYDASFCEAVANMLAADLCYSLTQSLTARKAYEDSGEYWISQARSFNSQEVTPDSFQFDMFLDARIGGNAVYD